MTEVGSGSTGWRARGLSIIVTVIIVGIAAAELVIVAASVVAAGDLGDDFLIYRANGSRWLESGELYFPHQLDGPYLNILGHSVLYPPTALLVFVPLSLLPLPIAAAVWWTGPVVVGALLLRRYRPAYLVWPILAIVVAWPRTIGGVLFGNTDMWVATAVAGGLLWAWPAVFVALKPTALPLALIGIRERSWWIAATGLAVASLLFLPLWPQYFTAIANVEGVSLLSSTNILITVAPLIVWIARRREPAAPPDPLLP